MLNDLTDFSPVWISLKTATVATAIAFFLGVAIARGMLDYKGKFKGAIDGLLTAPLVLPPTVVGFLLLLLLGRNGFVGQILASFGINVVFSWYATVIAATVVAFPLMYKTALGAFKQIDPNLIACAKTLGASQGRIFWQIIIPLAKPGLIAGTLLTFARALGEFGATIMLAGSIPGKTETIPIAIFLAASGGAIDRALILVLVLLLICLSVMMAVDYCSDINKISTARQHQRRLKRRLTLVPSKLKTVANSPPARFELVVNIQKQLGDFCLDVSFTADRAPLGLLGASGAGKSLILRCIAGLETPDRGQIILNDRVLYDSHQKINLPPRDRACGFLFQNYALFPHLTVAENIAFGMPKLPQPQQVIAQHLATVDLLGKENRYPRSLSGGQQQRVALARAKASQANILLLDEPFSALDTHLRDSQVQLLSDNLLQYQGITLFVSHNLEEAYRVCQQLLVIDRGKAIAIGKKDDIFNHPPNLTTARLIGCKNFSRAVAISDRHIKAIDWDCILEVSQPIPESLSHIGIHSHQLAFGSNKINSFSCWLANSSQTQHHITFYLKLNSPAQHSQDYHLQAKLFKQEGKKLLNCPFPWLIQLEPQQIMLLLSHC